MKKHLINLVKTLISDTRATIFALVFVALVGGFAGLRHISKAAYDFSLTLLNSPTPLWVTIALFLLSCIYAYLKVIQSLSKSSQPKNTILPAYLEHEPTPGVFVYKSIDSLEQNSKWYCKHCVDIDNIESNLQMVRHSVAGKQYQCHRCQFKFTIPDKKTN